MNDEETVKFGRNFAKGILLELSHWFVIFIVISIVVALGRNILNIGVDSTDYNSWNRSSLRLMIDYGTGKQYLSDNKGGLIERGNK